MCYLLDLGVHKHTERVSFAFKNKPLTMWLGHEPDHAHAYCDWDNGLHKDWNSQVPKLFFLSSIVEFFQSLSVYLTTFSCLSNSFVPELLAYKTPRYQYGSSHWKKPHYTVQLIRSPSLPVCIFHQLHFCTKIIQVGFDWTETQDEKK